MFRRRARAGTGAILVAAMVAATATAAVAYTPNDPFFTKGAQWNLTAINAPKAWDTATGRGTTIAVVDSGVDLRHEDLSAKIDTADAWNFVSGNNDAQDDFGHGTHVAGIAAAITNNGKGVAGVAPDARIMPVKVLDSGGSGTESNVEAGIRWAADHHATVINLSLGDPASQSFAGVAISGGPALADAVQYAWSAGSIVVIAAGNNYITSSSFSSEPAIVVAATGRTNGKPSYSSSVGSAKWGISAPGGSGEEAPITANADDILSTYWDGSQQEDNAYAYDVGTSMAAPHVSGAAAVLRSLGLTPQQTVDRLLQTATPLGSPSVYGAGLLNLGAAVSGLTAAAAVPGPATGTARPVAASTPRAIAPTAGTTSGAAPARAAGPAPAATQPASAPAAAAPLGTGGGPPAVAGAASAGDNGRASAALVAGRHGSGRTAARWWLTGLAGAVLLAAAAAAGRQLAGLRRLTG